MRAGRDTVRARMLRALGTPRTTAGRDAGFSLSEVIVSVALIGLVLTSLTSFFVSTVATTSKQHGQQIAARLATEGIERVRALGDQTVTTGRDQSTSDTQWLNPVTGVASHLAGMREAWDTAATYPQGQTAALPTVPATAVVDGTTYTSSWYVGRCWQPAGGGDCTGTQTAGYVMLYRVLVAVTWPEAHCAGGTCSYVLSTMVSQPDEVTFNPALSAVAPTVVSPGDIRGDAGVAVSIQVRASGGTAPLTWSATGLPAGVSIDSSGLVTGAPNTIGSSSVTVRVIDGYGLTGSASFTWTVNALPVVLNPGPQTGAVGAAVSLPITVNGGTQPLAFVATGTWSASGLPPGLRLDAGTGVISGTPTAAGAARDVTVTVTDASWQTASVTFSWAIVALQITTPVAQSGASGQAVTPLQVVASGGVAPLTWSAAGLPPGLGINQSGLISGTATTPGTYTVTVTVVDGTRASVTTSAFTWTISSSLYITSPRTTQNSGFWSYVDLRSTATGGTGPYTWSATGLPSGLSISSSGAITGWTTSGTRFITTLTVTDRNRATNSVTLVWNVASGWGPYVIYPTGDQTTAVGTRVQTYAAATGGFGWYTWSATGLPAGVTMTSDGAISGTPRTPGTSVVTLTVTDWWTGLNSVYMYRWTVT